MPALGMGPTTDKRVGKQSMNKATIKFRVVDVNDCRPVAYFRRPGPLMNVTIPDHQYKFLVANGYNVKLISNVFSDGQIVPVAKADRAETPTAVIIDEMAFLPENFFSEVLQPAAEEQAGDGEALEEAEDEPATDDTDVIEEAEVIDPSTPLLETVYEEDGAIQVHVLPPESYQSRTKKELNEFLDAIKESLPPEVALEIAGNSLTKNRALEIVVEYILD